MKMQCPTDVTSVSFDGKSFEVDADGIVNVPEEAFYILLSHGLTEFQEKKKRKSKLEDVKAEEPISN